MVHPHPPARSSSFQSIISKGIKALSCTVGTNINVRYYLEFAKCGSAVILLPLVVHKEPIQVEYNDGSFLFSQSNEADQLRRLNRLGNCRPEPTSTADQVENA